MQVQFSASKGMNFLHVGPGDDVEEVLAAAAANEAVDGELVLMKFPNSPIRFVPKGTVPSALGDLAKPVGREPRSARRHRVH